MPRVSPASAPEPDLSPRTGGAGGDRPAVDRLWAVVPAGGAGTRLWPLSRAGHPKFLLDLTGTGRTLVQGTVDRLAPWSAPARSS